MSVCFVAINEGYGTDRQDTLEAFPFSQQLPKCEDEDAELRRKLRHMGKGTISEKSLLFSSSLGYSIQMHVFRALLPFYKLV